MTMWHRTRRGDLGLRALGSGSWTLAWLAIARLFTHHGPAHGPAHGPGAIAYALAAAGFLCASAGTALVTLGAHLFDPVEVSVRWRSGRR